MTAGRPGAKVSAMNAPRIGTRVELLGLEQSGDCFQPAVVVGRLYDPIHGLVLEMRFADARVEQRFWPTPMIRPAS